MNLKKFFLIGIIFILLSTTNLFAFMQNNNKKIYSSDYIKNYLYGSISHNENKHNLAAKNFNKNLKLSGKHTDYDIKYITSLIINEKFDQASKILLNVEGNYSDIFIFNFIKSIYFLKQAEYDNALKELNKIRSSDRLFNELKKTIYFWIELKNGKESKKKTIKNLSLNNSGIVLINQFLASRFVSNKKLYDTYNKEILYLNNFVRYKILSSWNFARDGEHKQSLNILKSTISQSSQNILLKQSYKNLYNKNYKILSFFKPGLFNHNLSEVFYLFSNLYQQRQDIFFSDLLLSISIEFNKNFLSNNLVRFENRLINNSEHKFNYLFINNLKNIGDEYKWYVNFNLLRHSDNQNISNLEESINSKDLFIKEKYMDVANFFRIKKNYESALKYYNKVQNLNLNLDWSFYYYKGICYERLKKWKKSEKNLLKSISLAPDKYTVINYLAYSWLERRENIDKATAMLERAVELSKGEKGYIIDSLGWAYFHKQDYDKAEMLLKTAYEKASYESEVYDHYGDVLWKQKKFLQASYIWQNALKLKTIEPERAKSIKEKIINGISSEQN